MTDPCSAALVLAVLACPAAGAASGATADDVAGGSQSRKHPRQATRQPRAAQQRQLAQQQIDLFRKGFAACLEPKGYTVK